MPKHEPEIEKKNEEVFLGALPPEAQEWGKSFLKTSPRVQLEATLALMLVYYRDKLTPEKLHELIGQSFTIVRSAGIIEVADLVNEAIELIKTAQPGSIDVQRAAALGTFYESVRIAIDIRQKSAKDLQAALDMVGKP